MPAIRVMIALAIVIWVARFWSSEQFGYYEDDYYRVVHSLSVTWDSLPGYLGRPFVQLVKANGTPLNESIMYLLAFLGYRAGGIPGQYFFGYLVLLLNAWLFFILIRRLVGNGFLASTAAFAYILFPADPTPAYLTHALGLQPTLTFLLLALYCYITNRRFWSYILGLCCLFTYETAFPVFLAAPLLKKKWDKRIWRELAVHGLILGTLFVGAVVLRSATGENRVSQLDLADTVLHAGRNVLLGPFTATKRWFTRPYESLPDQLLQAPFLLLTGFLAMLILLIAVRADWRVPGPSANGPNAPPRRRAFLRKLARLAAAAVVMFILAYPLTLTTDGTWDTARGGRVHLAAVVGASILLSCGLALLLSMFRRSRARTVFSVLLAVYFTGNVANGIRIQRDYIEAWKIQRTFWTDFIRLCPDMNNNTVFVIDGLEHLRDTPEAMVPGWNILFMPEKLYRYPGGDFKAPVVTDLYPDWRSRARSGQPPQEWFFWRGWDPQLFSNYRDARIVWLEFRNRRLHRRERPLSIGEFRLVFPSTPAEPDTSEKRPLYFELLQSPDEPRTNYFW